MMRRTGSWPNPNQGVWNSFSYDAQNRLTNGYGLPYSYDSAGRMTSYENIGATAFRGHAVRDRYNSQWYYYDNNGNMTARWTSGGWQNMSWDHENHLSNVSGAGLPTESYLYDTDGQRVRKTSNGVTTYYPNQYYEQSGSTITKYHYFNGQRVSMHTNAPGGWAHYDLHSDHLGSTGGRSPAAAAT